MTKETDLQISQNEIFLIDSFNMDALKEATRQAELRVGDENARKVRIDTRAYTLLLISVGLTGIFITVVKQLVHTNLIVIGTTFLMLAVSTIVSLFVLRPVKYAPLGTLPAHFLKTDLITENDNNKMLGRAISLALYGTHLSLVGSARSNGNRSFLLNIAIWLSATALIPTVVLFFNTIGSQLIN